MLVTTLADLLVPTIISKQYRSYNHLKDTISSLGTSESPVQKQQCMNLIIVGVLFSTFSLINWFIMEGKIRAHHWYYIGILIFGIGCILAGIFPEDPNDVEETSSGKIHGIASGLGFIFIISSLYWAIKIPELVDLQFFSFVFFILAILTFLMFLFSNSIKWRIFSYTGLYQRLNLIVIYTALIIDYVWLNLR
ncbi:MAG: DUF998 domain-containing protein [Promethearchaeota archaeon]